VSRASTAAIFWWLIVGAYTAVLPWSILVWDEAVLHLGSEAAAMAPLLLAVAMALAAVGWLFRLRQGWRQWGYLLAALGIGAGICQYVEFPAERLHLPEYILMTILVVRALRAGGCPGHQPVWTLAICLLLGIVDEIMQGLIPARFFDFHDIAVNGLASFAGILVLRSFGVTAGRFLPQPARFLYLPAFLLVIQTGLLALILIRIRGNLAAGMNGLAGFANWQAMLVLLWAVAGAGWACRHAAGWPATGAMAAFLTADAALALISGGVLLNLPFL